MASKKTKTSTNPKAQSLAEIAKVELGPSSPEQHRLIREGIARMQEATDRLFACSIDPAKWSHARAENLIKNMASARDQVHYVATVISLSR